MAAEIFIYLLLAMIAAQALPALFLLSASIPWSAIAATPRMYYTVARNPFANPFHTDQYLLQSLIILPILGISGCVASCILESAVPTWVFFVTAVASFILVFWLAVELEPYLVEEAQVREVAMRRKDAVQKSEENEFAAGLKKELGREVKDRAKSVAAVHDKSTQVAVSTDSHLYDTSAIAVPVPKSTPEIATLSVLESSSDTPPALESSPDTTPPLDASSDTATVTTDPSIKTPSETNEEAEFTWLS
jgi:hypothetical protein